MALKTKAVLAADIASYLADNSTGAITEAVLRARLIDLIDSLAGISDLAGKSDSNHTHGVASNAVAGFMSAGDKAKLDALAAGGGGDMYKSDNLAGLADPVAAGLNLGLGSAAYQAAAAFAAALHIHAAATTAADGFMSAADKTKLNSMANGATANSADAVLLARGNHTGTQAISTVTGLQAALDSKGAASTTVNAQTGTAYTSVLGDANNAVSMTNAAANTFTVPPASSVAYAIGDSITILQEGAGQTTITPGAGVTIAARGGALKLAGQYAAATLIKRGADLWLLTGDLTT